MSENIPKRFVVPRELINPFPDPITINIFLNNEVKQKISEIFNTYGHIRFFDVIQYLEKSKENKNFELSQIIAYYCCNMIKNNNDMSREEKQTLISDMYREIYINKDTVEEEININDTL